MGQIKIAKEMSAWELADLADLLGTNVHLSRRGMQLVNGGMVSHGHSTS